MKKKKTKKAAPERSKRGRPTVMTPETVAELRRAFTMGLSDREASLYAGINPTTLYDYCLKNPDFAEQKELLKESPKMKAKTIVYDEIEGGDIRTAQWYLERRDPDYSPTQKVAAIVAVDESEGELAEEALKRLGAKLGAGLAGQ